MGMHLQHSKLPYIIAHMNGDQMFFIWFLENPTLNAFPTQWHATEIVTTSYILGFRIDFVKRALP